MTTTQDSGDVIDLRTASPPPPPPPPTVAPHGSHTAPATRRSAPRSRATAKRSSDVRSVISAGLATFSLLVAAMVAFLFVFSGFAEARTQVGLRRRFEHDLANLRAPIGGAISTGAPVAELSIPAIGLRQVVVQGTTSGTLRSGPGHLRQTPLPGQEGNAVLFGRRAAYGAPFRHLTSLSHGDTIDVWTGEGHRAYVVDRVHTADASDGSELVNDGTNRLTLVTSDPAFVADRRLVLIAHLRGAPYAASVDPTPVTRAELGLSGETDAVMPLALWLEALLIVTLGMTWLFRRWARWSSYVVCVPILLAVGWLVFENLTRLLPATL